jgi:iron complex transport system substrate-binding protein
MTARWLAGLLLALSASALAAPVTDDRGVAVDLREPPRRIVTLLPSLTETVCELGACDRLVGVDDWSNWPAPVQALPHVGGWTTRTIERIVALRPDVVLLGSTARHARLQRLGMKVLVLDIKTHADVQRVLDTVGRCCRHPAPTAPGSVVAASVEAAAQRAVGARHRVYFEISSGPYAASESSHIGELLTRLGAANVVPARLGSVPKLNPEFVVRADPQLIMIAARDAPGLPAPGLVAHPRGARRPRLRVVDGASPTWSCGPARAWPKPRGAGDCLAGRLKDKR